jgi:hypothetical protein
VSSRRRTILLAGSARNDHQVSMAACTNATSCGTSRPGDDANRHVASIEPSRRTLVRPEAEKTSIGDRGGWSGARHPTEAALLVTLGDNAKTEKRLAGVVQDFHPPFRIGFNRIAQITQYFAGGFYRFQLNRAHVGEFDSVAVVRGLVTVTDHKKISRHISQPLFLAAAFYGDNRGRPSVQNSSHPEIYFSVVHAVLSNKQAIAKNKSGRLGSKQTRKEGHQPRLNSLGVIVIDLIRQCFPIERHNQLVTWSLGWNIEWRRECFAPCRVYSAFFHGDHGYSPDLKVWERNTLTSWRRDPKAKRQCNEQGMIACWFADQQRTLFKTIRNTKCGMLPSSQRHTSARYRA